MSERPRPRWLLALSLAISVVLLGAILAHIDAAKLGAVLARADLVLLVLSLVPSVLVNVPLSALALRSALAAHGASVSLPSAMRATVGHLALHAGATLVVGKAARALYVAREQGVEVRSALAAELSLLALKVAGLALFSLAGGVLVEPRLVIPSALVLLAGLAFALARRGAPGLLAAAFGWAVLMAAGQLAVFALALAALGAPVPLARVVAFFPVCLLGAKVPLALFGLGVREALVLVLLRGAASDEALLGAALAFALVEQLLPGLLGLAFAPRFVSRALRQ